VGQVGDGLAISVKGSSKGHGLVANEEQVDALQINVVSQPGNGPSMSLGLWAMLFNCSADAMR
jgi:hypothetical protein